MKLDAPLWKLQRLRELETENRRLAVAASRAIDVYGVLDFEPNCKVVWAAKHAACEECDEEGWRPEVAPDGRPVRRWCLHEQVDPALLPPRCGECPQEYFLDLPDVEEDVLYGGSAGGSKSSSLMIHALRSCVRYPGLQAFWFRRSFPELRHSILRTLGRYGYARGLGGHYNRGTYELRFDNGSVLTFAHAKNEQEAEALQSAEINALYLDERTTIPPSVIDQLYVRVRSGAPGVPCLGIRSATNPGSIGHLQVLEHFVQPTNHGAETYIDESGRTVRFIQARATDTPQLDPVTYESRLAGISDPALRAAMRDGSWDVFANQVFGEFRREKHLVPAMGLPEDWIRYGGLDYGWTAPSVYLLAAKDRDGRVWVYRELTMVQVPEPEQARRILAAEDVTPGIRAADPSMKQRHGAGMSAMSQYAIAGCGLREANNDRVAGWSRVHTFLAEHTACRYHHDLGWDTCPMLHIVEAECPRLSATLPTVPRDPKRPEDVDTDSDDHWVDSLRYLLMAIGSSPKLVNWADSDDVDPAMYDPLREPNRPIVDPADLHEDYGEVAAPKGAFAIGGEPVELDGAFLGGVPNPYR